MAIAAPVKIYWSWCEGMAPEDLILNEVQRLSHNRSPENYVGVMSTSQPETWRKIMLRPFF